MVNRPDFFDGLVELRPRAAADATRSSVTPSFPCINSSADHLAGGEILPMFPLAMVDMASAMVSSIRRGQLPMPNQGVIRKMEKEVNRPYSQTT